MKHILYSIFVLLFLHITLAQEYAQKVSLTPLVSLTCPQHDFNDNYKNAFGSGFELGINKDYTDIGLNTFVAWYIDYFKISDYNNYGTINSIHIGYNWYVYFLSTGYSVGCSRFYVPDSIYQHLGNNTGTELLSENNYNQLSFSNDIGLRFPIRPLSSSLSFYYHLVTVERAWMFWHQSLSQVISSFVPVLFEDWALDAVKHNNMAGAIFFKLVSSGITYVWYDYNYKHHNWPWHDSKALNYQRAVFKISFYLN
jgi:hypothetical protein